MTETTAVYVDGYNFYYGRIRGTPYKWIDVVRLFERLVHEQTPTSQMTLVRYFSAFCLARFSTHGNASTIAQDSFLRGHEVRHGSRFQKTMGTHTHDRSGTKMPRYVDGQAFNRADRVKVWKLEEKQTDVNIALAMYRDAASGRFSQLVVCSNDSDVEPVLRAIREDFPGIRLGVITPRRPPEAGAAVHRNMMSSLSANAHWARSHIHDEELASCQLPDRIQTGKKPIDRPAHW